MPLDTRHLSFPIHKGRYDVRPGMSVRAPPWVWRLRGALPGSHDPILSASNSTSPCLPWFRSKLRGADEEALAEVVWGPLKPWRTRSRVGLPGHSRRWTFTLGCATRARIRGWSSDRSEAVAWRKPARTSPNTAGAVEPPLARGARLQSPATSQSWHRRCGACAQADREAARLLPGSWAPRLKVGRTAQIHNPSPTKRRSSKDTPTWCEPCALWGPSCATPGVFVARAGSRAVLPPERGARRLELTRWRRRPGCGLSARPQAVPRSGRGGHDQDLHRAAH